MTRKHRIIIVRRLRPSPERLAAAAAVYDPGLLLALRAGTTALGRRAPRR
jgi:hypothetical protein